MRDFCKVCGLMLPLDNGLDCPRCANVDSELKPEVAEWIRDVVATAVGRAVERHEESSMMHGNNDD
jgi:hypothetical protein